MTVLDLSNNNIAGKPNFYTLKKNGVTGIMLKVTEGATFLDPVWKDWSARARKQGIHVGGYHFGQPDGGDPVKEAQWFAKNLGVIQATDFRPALDLEANPGKLSWSQLVAWSRAFNQEVFKRTGSLPLFYASKGWIDSMKATEPIGAGLWLAEWSNDGKPFNPTIPAPWKKVVLHQFTSKGKVKGLATQVDMNTIITPRPMFAHPLAVPEAGGGKVLSQ